MVNLTNWSVGLAFLAAVGGAPPPAADDPGGLARRLVGEWALPEARETDGDSVVVWTLKADGVVRLDGINARTRKAAYPGPMVGRWRVDGGELVCTYEAWNDRHQRPTQGAESEERFRVRSATGKELVLVVVARRGRPVQGGRTLRFTRFPGWGS